MKFESWVISISALLYFSVAVSYALKRDWPWFLTWFAYSVANVGLILAEMKR